MKHFVIFLALVVVAFPVLAAGEEGEDVSFLGPLMGGPQLDPVEDRNEFFFGEFTFGLWQRDSNSISSKFLEYRDIPNGAVAPYFRLTGKKGDYRYNLIGRDVTQKDQRYFGLFEGKNWKVNVDYTGIPHNFGNGGKSILRAQSDDTEWLLSDTLQESFQASVEGLPFAGYPQLLSIVQPTLDETPADVDIKLQRNRLNVGFSLLPGEGNFDIGVTYFNERRSGARTNNGTSFGFFNVIETSEPVRYITQDFGLNATARQDWGVVFAGFHYNDFSNKFDTVAWDNPWRGSDSTDPRAYLGPTLTPNGPKSGLAGLPPSNEAWTVNGGTTVMFGPRTRLSADLQFGQWKQNKQQFIPYTVNTAISTPSGENAVTAPLPINNLDGKIDVFAINGFFTSRLTDDLRLNARYRFYRNENKTPRTRFEEGYVRFDAVWEEIPRITVPFGWDSNFFDVYGTYDVGSVVGLEVGYKYNKINREFRETEHTTENTFRAAADFRFAGGGLVRALYEFGSRDFDNYDGPEGEHHSFLDPGPPANQTTLRRYDQAKRDRNRFGAQFQWSDPSGMFTVGASYFLNKDDYDDSPVPCIVDSEFCPGGEQLPLGLLEAEYTTFSLDADISPSDTTNFYAFYSREDISNFQRGRQSGAQLNFNPASNWSSTVDDKVDTVGAGANFTLVPQKWFLDFFYRYQKVDGNNAFTAGTALRPDGPEDIPEYDDTKINFFSTQVRYKFAGSWTLGVGGFYEDYEIVDTQTGQVLFYMPGSFFINANNGDYGAWAGWINLSYAF
jgi:MtrB/PioB family decaheme-associated outer membrane protein